MTKNNIRFCLIQSDLYWEDKEKNLEMFANKITNIDESTDVILLPEMFSTGFSMNAIELAENMSGDSVKWMKNTAAEVNSIICGSLIIEDHGLYFNRLIWMRPDGTFDFYNKRHLFRMAGEDGYYSSGSQNITIDFKGWKIRPLICYDLRFPVWSRNRYTLENNLPVAEFDVLLYVANWPAVRSTAWDILLRARAVENQCYCIGLNRVGVDGTGKEYIGNSALIDPKGNYIIKPSGNDEGAIVVELNYKSLAEFREKFPQGLDADNFLLS